MSQVSQTKEAGAQVVTESLLGQAIAATKQTAPDRTVELMEALTTEALKGTVTWSKNLTETIKKAIDAIDAQVSRQLAAVMHAEKFRKLEGSWRGLAHLVKNSACGPSLRIKVINATKKELSKDFSKALDFDQSNLFKKLYEQEFGTPGGVPYSALIGDYEFSAGSEDMALLGQISQVAAAAFCPFIAAAAPTVMGMDSWKELSKPKDLEKIFESPEFAPWRGLRENEDSRFVTLVMPRVLARVPYGAKTKAVEEFAYEEGEFDKNGKAKELNHENYCWMNAAYVMGTKLTEAFTEYGWCTAIRGAEGGGKVQGLPNHVFTSDDGDADAKCPTEIGITDRREAELSKLGFLPLCHYKNTDYAVFFGAQTVQKPLTYDSIDATENAAISARLPYIMSTSRIAHYLKVMARDKVGSFADAAGLEKWLNAWIAQYVNTNPASGQQLKAKFPFAGAKIKVEDVPGQPGSYQAVAWLKPILQLEELTTSMRLVAQIPQVK